MHTFLCAHFDQFLQCEETLPSWFPLGRTLLLPKMDDLSSPHNYHLITCLNIVYKLWTGCLTVIMSNYSESNHLIQPAQKGCSRGQHGCIDHLLLTNHVWHQVCSKNCSMSVAWIDCMKAFDLVPHNWILECLSLLNFEPS